MNDLTDSDRRNSTGEERAVETLRLSDARYRRLFETAQDGILILDAETGQVVDANPFMKELLGYSQEEFLGRKLWEIGPFKGEDASKSAFAELQVNDRLHYEGLPLEAKDGRRVEVEFISNAYLVDEMRLIQCNIRDITERIRVSQALIAANKELAFQVEEKSKRADELAVIVEERTAANKELAFQVEEKSKRAGELAVIVEERTAADVELAFQVREKSKRAGELAVIVEERTAADVELAFQVDEKSKRAGELAVIVEERTAADVELAFQVEEKGKRADELAVIVEERTVANKELAFQVEEKGKRADELAVIVEERTAANKELAFQVEEKGKRADELAVIVEERTTANKELAFQVQEKGKRADELVIINAELARSNAELEQFAYVATHDLQEPLRAVASCVQLLQKRYEGHLDEKADEFITHAVDGTKRMQTLINDLLAYSRISTHARVFASTNCDMVLQQALANLMVAIAESGAVVTRDALPTVSGDATQLTQLFQNLIGNALKFRGERPPEIHVGAVRHNGDWRFSVADNGIGMEPQYFERVFLVFQRLHTRKDYQGTGIGLAICKKVVERHGGRIWAESEPGQGATFCFTIPERK
jgi:PAS domain S-box-containing protein